MTSSDGWYETALGDVLEELDIRASSLVGEEASNAEVLSLTKDSGLIPQRERFEKRIATVDVSRYKVIRKDWLVYNPYVLWEGAIHALERADLGLVSPVYHVWKAKNACPQFLDYLLKTPAMLAAYLRIAQGTVKRRRAVRTTAFKRIRVRLPSTAHQETIAALLGSARAAVQARQHEFLLERERKKALAETLFSRGISQQAANGALPAGWSLVDLGQVVESGPLG